MGVREKEQTPLSVTSLLHNLWIGAVGVDGSAVQHILVQVPVQGSVRMSEKKKGELEYKQIRQVLDVADGDRKFRDEIAGQITVVTAGKRANPHGVTGAFRRRKQAER